MSRSCDETSQVPLLIVFRCMEKVLGTENKIYLLNVIRSSPRQENISKPPTGKTEFLADERIKVNPNGEKQGEILEKESPGIANNKTDQNRRQKELVLRRPRGNTYMNYE